MDPGEDAAGEDVGELDSGDFGTGDVGTVCEPGASEPCYGGPEGTEGVGACSEGLATCAPDGSAFGPCVGAVTPTDETCLTLVDDDCDGEVNESGEGCVCVPTARRKPTTTETARPTKPTRRAPVHPEGSIPAMTDPVAPPA